MKILVDMNLSPLWGPFLSGQKFEAVHWASVGDPGVSDTQILTYAAEEGFIILTDDLDFGTLFAASRKRSPSVVQMRTQEVLPSSAGALVADVLRSMAPQLEEGALITIDPRRQRVRLLPI